MNSGGGGSVQPFNASQVSADQSKSNVQTGIANATLNNTNQVTPYGNLNYTQTGGQDVGGNFVPSYTATQTLSPAQQTILDKNNDLSIRALNAASPLLDRVASTVATPLSFSGAPALNNTPLLGGLSRGVLDPINKLNSIDLSYTGPTDPNKLRDDAYSALTARSNTDLTRSRTDQQVQLANQGIAPGSEAWNRAMEGQDRAVTDASNQATINAGTIAGQDAQNAATLAGARSTLAGTQAQIAGTEGNLYGTAGNLEQAKFGQDQSLRNQWINEYTTQRNAPLTDYQSLFGLSGGVTNPTFANTPTGQIPMTDVTSPQIARYQGQVQQAQNSQANSNATAGGLFGLGGSILGGVARALPYASMFGLPGSDIRMKEDIRHIGYSNDGQRLYSFRYIGQPQTHVGLMAQEVERIKPHAVVEENGWKYVDYAKALEDA